LAPTLLQLGLSRQREYSARRNRRHMVGHPYGLISAHRSSARNNNRIPTTTNLALYKRAFATSNRCFGSGTFSSLFSTHPPLEDRIATLREMVVTPRR